MEHPRLSELTHDSIAFWFMPGNDGPPTEAAMRIAEAVGMPVSLGVDDYDSAERRIDAWLRDLSPEAQDRNVAAARARLERPVHPDLALALADLGVSPSAFMVLASEGATISADVRLRAEQDPLASIQAAIGAQREEDAIAIPLSADVYATGGGLLVRRGTLPDAVLHELAGRDATAIVDHPLVRGRRITLVQPLMTIPGGFDEILLDPLPVRNWREALGRPPAARPMG